MAMRLLGKRLKSKATMLYLLCSRSSLDSRHAGLGTMCLMNSRSAAPFVGGWRDRDIPFKDPLALRVFDLGDYQPESLHYEQYPPRR